MKKNMKWTIPITVILCLILTVNGFSQNLSQPNILLITVDDMNWNSVGVFGSKVGNLTPNIDAFASNGVRFERAYVTASNCSPSRVSMQTGLFPHQSGARGFYYINDRGIPTIPTILRSAGYYTGIVNKSADTNPSPEKGRYWDFSEGVQKEEKYSASAYQEKSSTFFQGARQARQPFYLVVNIADPHKPFFNDERAANQGFDVHAPSRIIDQSEVVVPGFLPDLPGVRNDLRNYFNSVRRADDCFGAVMEALENSEMMENTLVIFLSDHGMPFPFAKSCVYDNGLRTPLILSWPGHFEPGSVVDDVLISTIDLMPTILEAANLDIPEGLDYQGFSLLSMLEGADVQRSFVFGNFDENAQGIPRPSRGVISSRWNYTFNAWGTGSYPFRSATLEHRSFKTMQRVSQRDEELADRVNVLLYRPVEELYDLENDPDCLNNLVADPAFGDILSEMREALGLHMSETGDYLLSAFEAREDPESLNQIMETQLEEAEVRASLLKWKRWKNMAGPTKSNTLLFQPGW